jgi:hypothetical protein
MNFVKIAIFTLLLNFAIGMTMQMHPTLFDTEQERGGLGYDTSFGETFLVEVNGTLNPTEQLEDEATAIDRLLDKTAIGVLVKFLKGIDSLLYGVVLMVEIVFGPLFGDNQGLLLTITIVLRLIITLGYVKGAIDLWTGKRVET